MNDVIADFIEAISSRGINPPNDIIADGKLQRYDNSSWYVFHADFPQSGAFGSWKTGEKFTWTAKVTRELSEEEKTELRKRMEADKKRRQREEEQLRADAAKRASEIWASSTPAPVDHPYLTKKQIQPHGARAHKGSLVIPVTNSGKLVGLQFIKPEKPEDGRDKDFLSGTPIAGSYSLIGSKPIERLVITEGFATGASIYEATEIPVIVAFNAGNLVPVAKAMRERLPNAEIIIASDDDRWTKGNPGFTKASEATGAVQGILRRPVFKPGFEGKPTDFNDLAVMYGLDEVRSQILEGEPSFGVVPTLPETNEAIPTEYALLEPFPHMSGSRDAKPLGTIENLQELLKRMKVTVRYNVISKSQEILIPHESFSIDNRDNVSISKILSWASFAKMPTEKIPEYITYLSDKNPFNPVATWILSKPWDGRSRLEDLYNTVQAVNESNDPKVGLMKRTFMRRWMISAIAGAFRPDGVSAHGVLVFQGDQYLGKTAWFKRLVPEHLDVIADGMMLRTDDKDSIKQIISKWLVELGELDATFKRSDIAQLKAFITKDKDVIRLSYARRESHFARRTVFFASVNPKEFLHDPTGNRRFWVVACEKINHRHEIDMQQLWAEVYEIYKTGETWFLSGEEMDLLNEHNKTFEVRDPIEDLIQSRLDWETDKKNWTDHTISQLLEQLGIARPSQSELNRASSIVRKITGQNATKTRAGRFYSLPPILPKDCLPVRGIY